MKKIKGVTLVELLIGVIIIAIVSIGAFEFFRYCRRFIVESEIRLGAVNFARETMEFYAWDANIADTTGPMGWDPDKSLPAGGAFASEIADSYGGYREYNVRSGTESGGGYKVINVRVNWNY